MGNTEPAATTEAGRNALEVLRVAAIGLLVLYHVACLASPAPSPAARLAFLVAKSGYLGTDLLLALAGFLAVGSRARSGGAASWLARRYWRVAPTLAVFLVAYLYLIPWGLRLAGISPQSLPNYADLERARSVQWTLWTFTANGLLVFGQRVGAALEPLLTLALGAQLTVALAVLLPSPRRVLGGAGAALVLGGALRWLWLGADPYVPYSFPLTRSEGFFLGAAFAVLLAEPRARQALLRWRCKLAFATSVALSVTFVLSKGLPLTSPVTKILGYPVISLWSATVVLFLATARRCPAPLQSLGRLGRAAYTAYLVKLPLCFVVGTALATLGAPLGVGRMMLFSTVSLGVIWLAAAASTILIERPLRPKARASIFLDSAS